MKRVIPAALLLGCLTSQTFAQSPASSLEVQEAIVERVAIYARGRVHGEVRLVRRGSIVVLQTLLVTRSLERVAAKIRDKEEAAWPEGSDGYEASRRYREALAGAVGQVLESARDDRYRRLLIEMRLAPGVGGVAFAAPTTREEDGEPRILGSDAIGELASPCSWVRQTVERIAADRGLSLTAVTPLPSC